MSNQSIVTQELLNQIWQEEILKNNPYATPNQENPQGYVLGGQPGAGKSKLIYKVGTALHKNIIVINGDDFRKYHPQYAEFQEKYGIDAAKHTQEFSSKIVEAIFDKAVSERYNIVIEGTFRTSTTPLKTLKDLRDNGYKTGVLIQTCNKKISWESCIERYEKAKEMDPSQARYTPQEHHNLVCEELAKSIEKVYESNLADTFSIYIRDAEGEEEEFFNSTKDSELNTEKLNELINKSRLHKRND